VAAGSGDIRPPNAASEVAWASKLRVLSRNPSVQPCANKVRSAETCVSAVRGVREQPNAGAASEPGGGLAVGMCANRYARRVPRAPGPARCGAHRRNENARLFVPVYTRRGLSQRAASRRPRTSGKIMAVWGGGGVGWETARYGEVLWRRRDSI